MKLNGFSVSIPEGKARAEGYVEMLHGTKYTIVMENDTDDECDAEVSIDGQNVGLWRIKAHMNATVERPVHDTGRFTFYQVGSADAEKAGIEKTDLAGLISVTFKPEQKIEPAAFKKVLHASPHANGGFFEAGGTGLSGKSDQEFVTVRALEYDESKQVTIHLRLVATKDAPRPLFPKSTPIPPPVR